MPPGKRKKGISELLDFKFLGGACPQTALKTRAFGASQLPRLSEKSYYGPAASVGK